MATKHTVQLPCGAVATRTSQNRVYPFVLVGRHSLAWDLRRAQDPGAIAQDRKNFAYYASVASLEPGQIAPGRRFASDAREIEDARAKVAGVADAEAYAQAQLQARLAKIEEDKAAGRYDRFCALTWSSRRDLADKARSQFGSFEDLRILETSRS